MHKCQRVELINKVAYAVLKHPPSAPAKAAPKGVSCAGLDWAGIRRLGVSKYRPGGKCKVNDKYTIRGSRAHLGPELIYVM